jgi:hypothetical protein
MLEPAGRTTPRVRPAGLGSLTPLQFARVPLLNRSAGPAA